LEVGRPNCDGATLYSTVYPCLFCSKLMVECGIKTVVYDNEYNSNLTEEIMLQGRINIIKFKRTFDKYN